MEPATNSGFHQLAPEIQRWIYQKGWTGLRDAQERAVGPLLEGKSDVIIAAQTAAGKTEAAFLPILTNLVRTEEPGLAIYISPLKALINNQWDRLDQLCEAMDLPVTSWHGDANATAKRKFLRVPRGILLITPESIEAIFVRRGSQVVKIFSEIQYIVVDELHSFIGTARGAQMQSLLSRIEQAVGRRVPRVGLSATLGDMAMAAEYLRPRDGAQVQMIISESSGTELKIQVRGYEIKAVDQNASADKRDEQQAISAESVASHLYKVLRGSNNLVFPNSRSKVESYTAILRDMCEREGVPSEFWPHHGSLSADVRMETERALTTGVATGICTNTLELGIDIGEIASVAQIGPGPSVASLRQRLGRSGRRPGVPAILRSYALESQLTPHSSISDRLREGLVQQIAMINLLLRRWVEPPTGQGLYLSTLVQQIMSVVTEKGGSSAQHLFRSLCEIGPFIGIERASFASILREMAGHDLLMQDSSGLLLLGEVGEKAVDSHDFYAAFASAEEWKLFNDGRLLGSIPLQMAVTVGMRLIFAGRRWIVTNADEPAKSISVRADSGGRPPIFESLGADAHRVIREEMRRVLASQDVVPFLNAEAEQLLTEARTSFQELKLGERRVALQDGGHTCLLFPWSGDSGNNALVLLLQQRGIASVSNEGIVVEVGCPIADLEVHLDAIAGSSIDELEATLTNAANMAQEKWDWALPEAQLRRAFVANHLSLEDARHSAAEIADSARKSFDPKVPTIQISRPRANEQMLKVGSEFGEPSAYSRKAKCWKCREDVVSISAIQCYDCGWPKCMCGACGCDARLNQ